MNNYYDDEILLSDWTDEELVTHMRAILAERRRLYNQRRQFDEDGRAVFELWKMVQAAMDQRGLTATRLYPVAFRNVSMQYAMIDGEWAVKFWPSPDWVGDPYVDMAEHMHAAVEMWRFDGTPIMQIGMLYYDPHFTRA